MRHKKGYAAVDSIRNAIKNKNFPLVTAIIVAINVIVFIILEFKGSTEDVDFMLGHGALSYVNVVYGKEYYRLVTHFFLHFGYEHIIFNMFVLAALGYYIENAIHSAVFFADYFLSGIFAGIVSVVWNYYTEGSVVSAGASGAVYGIIGTLFMLIVINKGKIHGVGFLQVAIFIVLTLFGNQGNEQIDNAAHIAGFVFGAVFIYAVHLLKKLRLTFK